MFRRFFDLFFIQPFLYLKKILPMVYNFYLTAEKSRAILQVYFGYGIQYTIKISAGISNALHKEI